MGHPPSHRPQDHFSEGIGEASERLSARFTAHVHTCRGWRRYETAGEGWGGEDKQKRTLRRDEEDGVIVCVRGEEVGCGGGRE